MEIVWLDSREIILFHKELISEHGGLFGPPNEGALKSTLARPQNLLAYKPGTSVARLAASYGIGFAKNHCFPDGNKRVALISVYVFLAVNGIELTADEVDAVLAMRAISDGSMTEEEFADWIETNCKAD